MDSKEITLQKAALDLGFTGIALSCPEAKIALKAIDIHTRNCMIEILYWYAPNPISHTVCERIVDGFLSSEYFKDLQK